MNITRILPLRAFLVITSLILFASLTYGTEGRPPGDELETRILEFIGDAHYALGAMAESTSIGSVTADRTGFPGASVYSMTKAAVAVLARGLAVDFAPRGITVNTIQPGPTETDMVPADGPHSDVVKSLVPLKRLGHADEIAPEFPQYLGDNQKRSGINRFDKNERKKIK